MTDKPEFDSASAHKYFAVRCFNDAWDLIDKSDRTPEDNEQMIQLNQASLWHWKQRADCTNRNLSVGYWQASRIYALTGQPDVARKYGQLSLDLAKDEPPFYRAYAYEALARAEMVAGNRDKMTQHLSEAQKITETVTDPQEKKFLLSDLDGIK